MKIKRLDYISIIIVLLNFVVTAFIYTLLPEKIPMHWNAAGEVDRFGNRVDILFMSLIPAFMYLILFLLSFLDKRVMKRINAYKAISRGVIALLLIIQYAVIMYAFGWNINMGSVSSIGMGILLIVIGNFMPQLKQNTVAGVRLPWTLKDEQTWIVTHRVGGYSMVITGLIISLMGFVVPSYYAIPVSLIAIIVWTIGLSIYSYVYFKKRCNEKSGI
ncbi:MAG: SdpI family protein [Bacillota bacterium]